MNKKIFIVIIVVILVLGYFIFNIDFESKATSVDEDINNKVAKEENNSNVKIDIKGMVKNPGVYEVDSNSRVNDIIKIAGGLKKEANTNYINLSAKVKDEMVIWIYSNKEIKEFNLEKSSTKYMLKECNCPNVDNTTCLNNDKNNNSEGLININTADESKLSSLEGIGPSKAKAIIEYRNKMGKFKTIEDIKNVNGIGESAYSKIKDFITV